MIDQNRKSYRNFDTSRSLDNGVCSDHSHKKRIHCFDVFSVWKNLNNCMP